MNLIHNSQSISNKEIKELNYEQHWNSTFNANKGRYGFSKMMIQKLITSVILNIINGAISVYIHLYIIMLPLKICL